MNAPIPIVITFGIMIVVSLEHIKNALSEIVVTSGAFTETNEPEGIPPFLANALFPIVITPGIVMDTNSGHTAIDVVEL